MLEDLSLLEQEVEPVAVPIFLHDSALKQMVISDNLTMSSDPGAMVSHPPCSSRPTPGPVF